MTDELAKAIASFYRIYNKKSPDIPIKSSEMGMLIYFFENPGFTAKEASDYFHISKPSVTLPLQALENAGLIYKQQDEQDKRKFRIFPSPVGKQLITNMIDSYNDYARKLQQKLGKEKTAQFLALLTESVNILEE